MLFYRSEDVHWITGYGLYIKALGFLVLFFFPFKLSNEANHMQGFVARVRNNVSEKHFINHNASK
jgi:hypothetical protein